MANGLFPSRATLVPLTPRLARTPETPAVQMLAPHSVAQRYRTARILPSGGYRPATWIPAPRTVRSANQPRNDPLRAFPHAPEIYTRTPVHRKRCLLGCAADADRPNPFKERRDGSVRLFEAPDRAVFRAESHWLQDAQWNFRARVRRVSALDHHPIHIGSSTGRTVRRPGIEGAAAPGDGHLSQATVPPIGGQDSSGSGRLVVVSQRENAWSELEVQGSQRREPTNSVRIVDDCPATQRLRRGPGGTENGRRVRRWRGLHPRANLCG